MQLKIVTGLSGAGKSAVMNALEDLGMFCIDNLPASTIPVFAKLLLDSEKYSKVAVSTDIRTDLNLAQLRQARQELDRLSVSNELIFVDCDENELLLRYKQTRRIHPLVNSENCTLSSAIEKENAVLAPIRNEADFVLCTTGLSVAECKTRVSGMFSARENEQMNILCMSFGFKHGIPVDADFVFDARFLPNPFYVPELKAQTGLDKGVRDFVMNSENSAEFERRLFDLVDFVVPECIKEGKSQLVIAIGCTGGHHRSVTFTEALALRLKSENYNVSISHRDIKK